MQRPAVHRNTTIIDTSDHEQILYFPLPEALPEGHTLALHTSLGTLSYLYLSADKWPRLLLQQQFTSNELSLLRPLLEQYPHYCPHEVMFASFYSGSVNEKTIARARERLQEAMEEGTWDYEMRPVRNVLSRIRVKVRVFGLDIHSILETGYIMMVTKRLKIEERA